MIDEITAINKLALRRKENNNDEMLDAYYHSALKPDIVIQITMIAMRYLALRDAGVLVANGPQMMEYVHGSALDAAADKLLENKK